MHPKIREFLHVRDRAYLRGDSGVVRSMNAELRRYGVPDEATLANPAGTSRQPSKGRPKLPRCEHGSIVDRCEICREDSPVLAKEKV